MHYNARITTYNMHITVHYSVMQKRENFSESGLSSSKVFLMKDQLDII